MVNIRKGRKKREKKTEGGYKTNGGRNEKKERQKKEKQIKC